MITLPQETLMTKEVLGTLISAHKALVTRYERLENMYTGLHVILDVEAKAEYKPDNRLVCNFAKYIVDTMNGFFIGIPIKVTHEDDGINEYLEFLDKYNNQDDNNAELSKICGIYGHGYELLYMDETANVGITFLKPTEGFVVYDDSVLHRPMFSVRYYLNYEGTMEGTYADTTSVYHFNSEFAIEAGTPHPFGGIPMIEYVENEERMSAFENVETLINAYDKAISEKANDVDYYADAYLKILGASLDEDTLAKLRDSRIINLDADAEKIVVEFLQKPEADGTQENLINRLEKLIFHLSMVANINDENFGGSSGIALKYKLQSMNNLAKTKERKFTAGMTKRYKLVANVPTAKIGPDDWTGIQFKFTRNIPNNELEESEIAKNLAGIVSKETQLNTLSIIEDASAELERIKAEADESAAEFARTTPTEEVVV